MNKILILKVVKKGFDYALTIKSTTKNTDMYLKTANVTAQTEELNWNIILTLAEKVILVFFTYFM